MPTDEAAQNLKSTTIPVAVLVNSIKHLTFQDLSRDLQAKLKSAGSQATRSNVEAAMMFDKVPAPFRTSIESIKTWLEGKDASHIISRYNGGSDNPINLLWEERISNRLRGSANMPRKEQLAIVTKGYVEGLGASAAAGLQAAPIGAVIAAVTAMPITFLRYSFAVAKGEMTKEEATKNAIQDVAKQGVIGGLSTAVVVPICVLCPPVAAALTFASPVLLSVGIAGMCSQYFDIISENREIVLSEFSKNKGKLEQLADSVKQIRSSLSSSKMTLKEDQEAIQQVRTLQFKAQFGFKFWLQWVFATIIIGVSSLVGVGSLAGGALDQGSAGLLLIICMSLSVGFVQWLLIRLRTSAGIGVLFLNVIVVLVSLLVAASLLSTNSWLSLAVFLSCTILFTVLSINRTLPKLVVTV
jgi:hypothetical protein